MTSPLFSVIIPTHNRPSMLREAVDSVLSQTLEDFEIIVVNDGGRPVTGLTRDPRLVVVDRQTTEGPAAARNSGIEAASGRHLAFLDDDDLFVPRRLELALEGFARAPIVLCLIRAFSQKSGTLGPAKGRMLEGDVYHEILDDFTPHVGRTAVVKDIVPRFDERYLACEDVGWWIRLAERGKVTTVPEVGFLQRGHSGPRGLAGSESRLEFNRRLLIDHADYFASHRLARKFRYQRIGMRELAAGEVRSARESLVKSLAAGFSLRSAWHLLRTFKP